MIISGPPLFKRTLSPCRNRSIGLSPVVERMEPAHRGQCPHTRRPRVLPVLPLKIRASQACREDTPAWEFMVASTITLGVCACVHQALRQRPQSVADPLSFTVPPRPASSSPSMTSTLLGSHCKRYATSIPRLGGVLRGGASPHIDARTA